MSSSSRSGRQVSPLTQYSQVVAAPHQSDERQPWTDDDFRNAVPERLLFPSQASSRTTPKTQDEQWPLTFVPPYINHFPYDAMCKVFYRRNGMPFVASGWVVTGNTGIKAIITSGHVVYMDGHWSRDYVVYRGYSGGRWFAAYEANFARTLNGWIHGHGPREFWDIGAILPSQPLPGDTPALPVVWNYDPRVAPYNFFADTGYPAEPANGYPFDGTLLWESEGPLVAVHPVQDHIVLEASNAMGRGSSGSPWLIRNPNDGSYWVAGIQSSGRDGIPTSFSPYFDQRNIVSLLVDIGVLG